MVVVVMPGINGEDQTLEFTRKLMKHWDGTGQKEPLFVDWKEFDHPQLGKVEIGGLMETVRLGFFTFRARVFWADVWCTLTVLADAHEPADGDDGPDYGWLPWQLHKQSSSCM